MRATDGIRVLSPRGGGQDGHAMESKRAASRSRGFKRAIVGHKGGGGLRLRISVVGPVGARGPPGVQDGPLGRPGGAQGGKRAPLGPRGPGGGLAVAWRWPWRRPLSTPEPSLTTNGRVGCEFGRATWTTSVRGSASASTTVYREPSQSRHPSRALSGQGGGGGDLLRRRTAGNGGGGCRVPDSPAPRLPDSPETQRQARATGDAAGDARNGNAAGDARNGRRSGRRTQRRRSGRRREEPRRSGQRSGEEREEEEPGEEQRREHPSPAGLRAGNASGTAWKPLWDALETALEHLVGSLHWGGSSRGSCAGPCRGFFLRCAHTFDQRTMPGKVGCARIWATDTAN